MMTRRLSSALGGLALACLSALAGPLQAQNLFAPVARVDNSAVTRFELENRIALLELFNAPGVTEERTLDTLIDERLQVDEAQRLGIEVSREELVEGMTEFAGRANLPLEEFQQIIVQAGVNLTAFEDFVRAGLAWREVVADTFRGRVTLEQDEVERAADAPPVPELRFLLNEIILPANTPERAAQADALAPRILASTDFGTFSALAREFSASASRERGGAIDFLSESELPPPIVSALRQLSPGEVTGPIGLPNAQAFFQLRRIDEVVSAPVVTTLDYAAFYLPGGRSPATLQQAAEIRASIDTCDDLYGIAQGLPASRLQRDTLPPTRIPADVALELARLDEDEVSTALTRANGQTLVFLMLCDRSYRDPAEDAPDLDALRDTLVNRRAGQLADNYLDELRANARIEVLLAP